MSTRLAAVVALAGLLLTPRVGRAASSNATLWFVGGSSSSASTMYYHVGAVITPSAGNEQELPVAAELSNFTVQCNAPVTVGTQTFTTVINGTPDTTFQCVLTGGASSCTDTVGTLTVAPTDRILVQSLAAASGTSGACVIALAVRRVGGAPYDNLISFGGNTTTTPASGTFCAPNAAGNASNGCNQTTEANAQWIAPSAGTLTGLRVRMSTGVGTARTETFTVKNSTTGLLSDLAVTVATGGREAGATTCTTNCAFAAGDQLTVAFTRTGTAEANARNLVVTTDNASQGVTVQHDLGVAINGTRYTGLYFGISGAVATSAWPVPAAGTGKNLRASLPATAAGSVTVTLCSAAAGVTPVCTGPRPTCTIAAGSLTCSDTTNTVSLAPTDVWNLQATVAGGGVGNIAAAASFEIGPVAVLTPTPTATALATTAPVVTVTPTPVATASATPLAPTVTPTPLATPTVPAPTRTATPTPTATATSSALTPTPTATATPLVGPCVLRPKALTAKQLGAALTAKGLCQ